jgi:hypothetical protein
MVRQQHVSLGLDGLVDGLGRGINREVDTAHRPQRISADQTRPIPVFSTVEGPQGMGDSSEVG